MLRQLHKIAVPPLTLAAAAYGCILINASWAHNDAIDDAPVSAVLAPLANGVTTSLTMGVTYIPGTILDSEFRIDWRQAHLTKELIARMQIGPPSA